MESTNDRWVALRYVRCQLDGECSGDMAVEGRRNVRRQLVRDSDCAGDKCW